MSALNMNIKNTLCALTMLVSVVASSQASANVGQPKAKWNVGPIHIKGENGFQYCSMKTAFDNGTMLVLARDAGGVNSIALDFQDAVLETGEEYNVDLQVVNGIHRKHSAIAASQEVLVLQVGRDHAFYESLNKKNQLNILMDGAKLSYSLKGSGKGLDALDDCVSGLDTLTVDEYASRLEKKQTSVTKKETLENDKVWAKNLSLKQEIKDLKAANAQLTLAKKQLDEKVSALKETPISENTIGNENGSLLKTENLKLLSTLAEYEQKISTLELDLAKKTTGSFDQHNIAVLKGEVLSLRQQLSSKPVETEDCSVNFGHNRKSSQQDDMLVDLLIKAHVAMAGDIEIAQSQPGLKSYNWQSGVLFGGAQQYEWEASKNFHNMADDYIQNVKNYCTGEFASSFGEVQLIGGNQFLEAELACIVDNTNTAAAAVLFYGNGNRFTAVLHEGTTEQLYTAIAKRDAILDRLYQR